MSNNFTAMMFLSLLFLLFVSSEPTRAKLFHYFKVIRPRFLQVSSMCTFVTEVKSKMVHSSLIPSSSCKRFCGLANRSTPSYANTMNRSVKEEITLDQSAAQQGVLAHLTSGSSCFQWDSFLGNSCSLQKTQAVKGTQTSLLLTRLGWVRPESGRRGNPVEQELELKI